MRSIEVLDQPGKASRLFSRYEKQVNRAMDVYLRFVDAWYTKGIYRGFFRAAAVFGICRRR